MIDGYTRDSFDEIGKRVKREIDASPNRIITSNNNSNNNNNNSNSNNSSVTISNNQTQVGRRVQMPGPPGTVLNTITPCAACKLLRRRCAEECPFSPYFSPHEPQKFAAVHKVFGASNVSKMLLEVPESQRADAANSLVYEANVRLRDPVYGCMGAISALQRQVQTLTAELSAVRAEILKFKYREAASSIISSAGPQPLHHHHHHAPLVNSSGGGSVTVATSQQQVAQPQPPATPPLVSVVGSSSPAATSALYTPPSSTGGFSSISSESVPYFD